MAVAYNSSKIVTNGLVLCLDAANRQSYPGSGTTWTDLSGTGSNGTLTNGPTYTSANAGAIVFDGVDDSATVPDIDGVTDFNKSNNYTVDFWVYINSTQNNTSIFENYLVEKWDQNVVAFGYPFVFRYIRTGANANKVYVAVYDGTNSNGLYASSATDTWINYCGVFNWSASLLSVYRNAGQPDATIGLNVPGTISNTSQLFFGRRGTLTSGYLTGRFSSIKIYNRALSAAEIQQNFNATRGRFGV